MQLLILVKILISVVNHLVHKLMSAPVSKFVIVSDFSPREDHMFGNILHKKFSNGVEPGVRIIQLNSILKRLE